MPLISHIAGPLKLHCSVQHDEWGMRQDCYVKRFAPRIESSPPYAELWIGAHPAASSRVVVEGGEHKLCDLVRDRKDSMLGSRVGELPLLKVLSIGSPLSIQAHPDKALAAVLHRKDPRNYPDENDKPEMAVALTPLELLYGFRSEERLARQIQDVPELADLIGAPLRDRWLGSGETREVLTRDLYVTLMKTSPERLRGALTALLHRLRTQGARTPEDVWVLRLADQYGPSAASPGDAGLFSFYVMNLETLAPGDAIYIHPNTPHAYLSGELVECMRSSDNVVRAGLTQKIKDLDTLLAMLSYIGTAPQRLTVQEERIGGIRALHYQIMCPAFALSRLNGSGRAELNTANSPELLLCLSGQGEILARGEAHEMQAGAAFFIPASLGSYSVSAQGAEWFRAVVP